MLPFYSFTFVLLLACAVFFYRAGELEGGSGVAWAALSVLVSVAIWHWLNGRFIAVLLGQVGLFAVITLLPWTEAKRQKEQDLLSLSKI
jgi:hypothetical protein